MPWPALLSLSVASHFTGTVVISGVAIQHGHSSSDGGGLNNSGRPALVNSAAGASAFSFLAAAATSTPMSLAAAGLGR